MIKLTNTLTRKKEAFKPINPGKAGMYNCGPTVYDYPHIGNLRKYVFDDILRRTLELNGLAVTQVINITDFGHLSGDTDEGEDKMTKGLRREGKPLTLEAMKELGDFYTEKFKEDLTALNIIQPEVMPKASEHIQEDIDLIATLESKGYIYKTSTGLYFDTSKVKDYGKLGGISKDADESASRIGINAEKKHFRDFAVWKFSSDGSLGFESPWGKGFPGWHIECSAMSMKYLGETFDIHSGGIDHIPVHHNNEIAQSEAATGKRFVNYWVHQNFLNVDNTKISKSLNNTFTLKDIREKNIDPLAYRYWLLTAHYASPVNFTWEALEGAATAHDRLREQVADLPAGDSAPDEGYLKTFRDAMNDDLDTPKAVALLWDLMKDPSLAPNIKKATIQAFDRVLGLSLDTVSVVIPENVQRLIDERTEARSHKDWNKADDIRNQLRTLGFDIKDTDKGTKVFPYRG